VLNADGQPDLRIEDSEDYRAQEFSPGGGAFVYATSPTVCLVTRRNMMDLACVSRSSALCHRRDGAPGSVWSRLRTPTGAVSAASRGMFRSLLAGTVAATMESHLAGWTGRYWVAQTECHSEARLPLQE
jgi:hypothetical protein